MPKISKSNSNDKSKNIDNSENQEMTISLKYITTNKNYNFDFFANSQKDDKLTTMCGLLKRISEMNEKTWKEALALKRQEPCGMETIYYSELKFQTIAEDMDKSKKV